MTTTLSTLNTRLKDALGDTEADLSSYYLSAINDAAREIYPTLHKKLRDLTLITGQILPNYSFEDWLSSSYPDFYNLTNATAAETTTAGLYRGPRGTSSCKVTASAANGYMYITSKDYPQLLDLMGETVDFYCDVYPQAANDGAIVIYTIQPDGTEQTLTSSTANPATKWTKLELESQALNDDLDEIQIRFKVTTSGNYAYFDRARLYGPSLDTYLLPRDFLYGDVWQVNIQTNGNADDLCDDFGLVPRFKPILGGRPDVISDGTYKYLKFDYCPVSERTLEIIGTAPLEDDLDADADTLSLDDPLTNRFILFAAIRVYERARGSAGSRSVDRYDYEIARLQDKYDALGGRLRMSTPTIYAKVPTP